MDMITAISFDNALWRKSSRSGAVSNCVEVAITTEVVGVRDSKNPDKKILIFLSSQWRCLIRTVTLIGFKPCSPPCAHSIPDS